MKIFSSKNIISTIVLILVLKYFSLIFSIDFLDPIQNTIEDFKITDIVFSQRRTTDDVKIDTNIVLVNVGKLNRFGIAKEIEILNQYEPKIVAIDAFFSDEKNPDNDSVFAEVLGQTKNLIIVSELKEYDQKNLVFDTIWTSTQKFNQYAINGFANMVINKSDYRTVRLFMTVGDYKGKKQNSFPVEIARLYDSGAAKRLLDRQNRIEVINYKRNTDKYQCLNYAEIFDGERDLSFIKDKIVLMGYMGPDLVSPTLDDMFYTSMNDRFVGKSYPDMYGVVVHANIISMILDGDYCYKVPFWLSSLFIYLFFFVTMTFFTFLRERHDKWYESISILLGLFQLVVLFFILLYIFYFFNISMDIEGIFFGVIFAKQAYEIWNDSFSVMIVDFIKKRKLPNIFVRILEY
jgi:CHASE2 domain-containing sensor protein